VFEPNAFHNVLSAIQTATSPVILISGVGLLLLTMTNRLGRAIDRARSLSSSSDQSPAVEAQISVLMKRAKLLRKAILFAVGGALVAGVLVIVIFLMTLWEKDLSRLIGGLFILSMTSMIFSLIYFMRDVNLSLAALRKKLKG
jgi:hypothetical protein